VFPNEKEKLFKTDSRISQRPADAPKNSSVASSICVVFLWIMAVSKSMRLEEPVADEPDGRPVLSG
jgi:hypothetical protein